MLRSICQKLTQVPPVGAMFASELPAKPSCRNHRQLWLQARLPESFFQITDWMRNQHV
jgi:hypothetical protein